MYLEAVPHCFLLRSRVLWQKFTLAVVPFVVYRVGLMCTTFFGAPRLLLRALFATNLLLARSAFGTGFAQQEASDGGVGIATGTATLPRS